MNEFECPLCGAANEVPNHVEKFNCSCCDVTILISPDADFVNGMWRDQTKLTPVKHLTTK